MAKKTHDTETTAPPVEQRTSPAMTLDGDDSPADVSGETKHFYANDDLHPSPPHASGSPQSPDPSPAPSGRPFCGKHNCLMKAVRSSKTATHFSCPVPLCDAKEKRARASINIPREPNRCPDVRCSGKVESFLEVDLRRSTTAHLCMVCPKCGFDIKVTRPAFNSGVRTYERDEGDLAAR